MKNMLFFSLQTNKESKYIFGSSYVEQLCLSPLFPRVWTSLNMFFINLYVYSFTVTKTIAKLSFTQITRTSPLHHKCTEWKTFGLMQFFSLQNWKEPHEDFFIRADGPAYVVSCPWYCISQKTKVLRKCRFYKRQTNHFNIRAIIMFEARLHAPWHVFKRALKKSLRSIYVIVIPWVVRLNVEIIHEL